jgi:hypothetical protein
MYIPVSSLHHTFPHMLILNDQLQALLSPLLLDHLDQIMVHKYEISQLQIPIHLNIIQNISITNKLIFSSRIFTW